MSRDGPPASSFTEPRLTGFLTKQGGQGIMSANWRKRYFVLDNHYLFYYKSKQDRKPVGVVCLSDYKSCHKASPKDSRKSKFTFVIEKGEHTEQELGYAIRNYYIYAESEAEMNSWIESISREISSTDDFTRKGPKVDIKAFDELSTTVEGGMKLSHPTAARPKPQGRRPPRKYIPYNEEEDGSSPRIQKRPVSDSTATTTLEDSTSALMPSKSPLAETHEESTLKRGQRPPVAMVPKQRSIDNVPPQPSEELTSDQEPPSKETTGVSKPAPIPPPTSAKPKHRTSIKELSPPPPTVEEEITTPERQLHDNEVESKIQEKPQPPTASKPVPPPTKPKNKRSLTDVSKDTTINDISSPEEQLNTSIEEQLPTDNNKFSKPSPPRKVKKLVVEPASEGSNNTNTSNIKPVPKPRAKASTNSEKRLSISMEESTTANSSDLGSPVEEGVSSSLGQISTSDTENSLQEISTNFKEIQDFIQDVKEAPILATEGSETGQNPTVKKIGYENVTINLKQDGQLSISAPEGVKEDIEREIKEKKEEMKKQPDITTPESDELSTTNIGSSPVQSSEDPPVGIPPQSIPIPVVTNGGDSDGLYDVPSPNKVAIRMSPEEEDGYDVPKLLRLHTDTPTRQQQQVSSMDSSDYDIPSTFGTSVSQTTPPRGNSVLSDDSLPKDHLSPERDAWGYAVVNKKRNQPPSSTTESSNTNGVPSSLAADTLAAHVQIPEDIASIPMNLQKAKEILRLAMIVKTEVLEMRREVESELAIARRERHDSQLMKQNAAEILKMAKDVLQRVQS